MVATHLHRIKAKRGQKGIALGECLTESEIVGFERKWEIKLPDEYREFLKQIGNGGKGPPYYDMYKLGVMPGHEKKEADRILARMKDPFPLEKYWVWDGDSNAVDEAIEEVFQGHLRLGTDGCGLYWVLIVTGAERGRIWNVCGEGAQPCAPSRGFLSWYEFWLDGGKDYYSEFRQECD